MAVNAIGPLQTRFYRARQRLVTFDMSAVMKLTTRNIAYQACSEIKSIYIKKALCDQSISRQQMRGFLYVLPIAVPAVN